MNDVVRKGPVTILVAEDETAQRMILATTLRTEGYTVLEAADGPAAEALAGKHGVPVDLLVTDFVMPGIDGHQLAERLRSRFPAMRVLLVSGHIDEEPVQKGVMEEAFKKGAAFLQKPFTPDELLRKVRAVLAGLAAG
jgi:two-component system cell cycle sensor histidine kinase/response regulator CckA